MHRLNIKTWLSISPTGFDRTVPGYPRYKYLGTPSLGEHHLFIQGVSLKEDGEYQCQVGPTPHSASLSTAANVTVLGKFLYQDWQSFY